MRHTNSYSSLTDTDDELQDSTEDNISPAGNSSSQKKQVLVQTAVIRPQQQDAASKRKQQAHVLRSAQERVLQSSHRFVFPPEQHFSIDLAELKQALRDRLPEAQRHDFDEFLKLLQGVASFDFQDLQQRIRKNFQPFACGASNGTFLQRSSKALPHTSMLDKQQEELIADVYEVLRASHYTLLTRQEWGLATAENFNLNLPIDIQWQAMDPELLTKFWASTPQRQVIRKALPDTMADRIMVFHRGIGTEQLSGLLLQHKTDLLMEYTLGWARDQATEILLQLQDKVKAALGYRDKEPPASPTFNKRLKDYQSCIIQRASDLLHEPNSGRQSAAAAAAAAAADEYDLQEASALKHYELEDGVLVASHHRFAKTVERVSLARQCPSLWKLLAAIPRKMELQEPTYKDIVVLYRHALPPRKPPTATENAPNKTKNERMRGILAYRNIHLKVFGETPMADVEMIFPQKKMGYKLVHVLRMLLLTALAAVVLGVVLLRNQVVQKPFSGNVVWAIGSLILIRMFTLYSDLKSQHRKMEQLLAGMLFDKMRHSQEGVISVIVEEMADQQLKQMLLAYVLLLLHNGSMSAEELDKVCEDFMHTEFSQDMDFDISAALPRLKSWYLVQQDEQGRLHPMALADAVAVLQNAWSTAYTCIGGHRGSGGMFEGTKISTADLITGKFSVFGEGIKLFLAGRKVSDAVAAARSGKAVINVAKGVSAGVGAVAKGVEDVAGSVVKGAGSTLKGAGKSMSRAFSRIASRSSSGGSVHAA